MVRVYFGDALGNYGFGHDHPFGSDRIHAFWKETVKQGLDKKVDIGMPSICTKKDLTRFHTQHHVDKVYQLSKHGEGDGGYASTDNLKQAKEMGVKDVAFHKKKGLKVEDMTKSTWVYRKLCNFRAGIGAGISYLKRSFGLGRCSWKGLAHFKAYVWASVVAHNWCCSLV
jgi:transposase, IS5 family